MWPARRRIAVLAASGKTGRAISAALAARGGDVVPVGRASWERLPEVLDGCDAVCVVAPNLYADEPAYVREVLDAAETAGARRVVYHSVAAPYVPQMPHHVGKARSEDLVRRSPFVWTILQPCAYVQNFVPALRSGASRLEVPYDVGRPFGLVDLSDVAEATATVLSDDGHAGATYELGGPALVSVADVAAAASEVLGRAVTASRLDPESWRSGPGGNLDPRERSWLLAMFGYYDRHGLPAGGRVLRGLLDGRSTTLVETIRRELARA
jgi:NAD(P)H dehydrogenase (quinone)